MVGKLGQIRSEPPNNIYFDELCYSLQFATIHYYKMTGSINGTHIIKDKMKIITTTMVS